MVSQLVWSVSAYLVSCGLAFMCHLSSHIPVACVNMCCNKQYCACVVKFEPYASLQAGAPPPLFIPPVLPDSSTT